MTADQPKKATLAEAPAFAQAHLPEPPSERGSWLLAGGLGLLGAVVLVAALTLGGSSTYAPAAAVPPVVPVVATTPAPSAASSASVLAGASGGKRDTSSTHGHGAIVAQPTQAQQQLEASRLLDPTQTHISTRWMEGFYPIYATAQRTFGVNWLLIASIHRQESAFSTAPGIYEGLNFAHCCGGPMQFNVTNGGGRGTGSTWQLVSDSYRYGTRPRAYDHVTARHPSIYDDFDSIMAAAHLLSADGAGYALDGSAWDAAYDYYGHDATGVTYADQVLARAIGWSQHSFCINCGVDSALIEAVHAAYGAPVLAALEAAEAAKHAATKPHKTRATAKPRPLAP
jgi:hypothetical protein